MDARKKGNLYILLTAILWSTGGILIKFVPGNAIAINGARSLIAFLFFWIYRRNIKLNLNKIIITAAICLTMTNTLFVAANKLTTAANAIVLQYMAPIFVLIWDSIYRKKAPSRKQIGIVAMAFGGYGAVLSGSAGWRAFARKRTGDCGRLMFFRSIFPEFTSGIL